jgi:hypothetical protein
MRKVSDIRKPPIGAYVRFRLGAGKHRGTVVTGRVEGHAGLNSYVEGAEGTAVFDPHHDTIIWRGNKPYLTAKERKRTSEALAKLSELRRRQMRMNVALVLLAITLAMGGAVLALGQ